MIWRNLLLCIWAALVNGSAAFVGNSGEQSSLFDDHHVVEKRELDPLTFAGPSIGAVEKLWDTINNDRDSSKIQLQIKNYSKYVLNIIFTERIRGETNQIPNLVEPGHMEAILAWGDWNYAPTEGIIGWSYRMADFCIIYWRVEHDRNVWRVPNRLGMGCFSTQSEAKSVADEIKDNKKQDEKNEKVEKLTWSYSHDDIQTLKHCEPTFCLQGSMPSTHQATVYVSLMPLSVSDWASETGISQEDVSNLNLTEYDINTDSTLGKTNHRAWYEPLLYTLAAVAFIGLIIFIICCIKKR